MRRSRSRAAWTKLTRLCPLWPRRASRWTPSPRNWRRRASSPLQTRSPNCWRPSTSAGSLPVPRSDIWRVPFPSGLPSSKRIPSPPASGSMTRSCGPTHLTRRARRKSPSASAGWIRPSARARPLPRSRPLPTRSMRRASRNSSSSAWAAPRSRPKSSRCSSRTPNTNYRSSTRPTLLRRWKQANTSRPPRRSTSSPANRAAPPR